MKAPQQDWDDVIDGLASLATHDPDPARAAHVCVRCHAVLRDRRRRQSPATRHAPHANWRRRMEPAIVCGLCVVFLFEVLSRALHLYRL
ncbi:MAG: hypothetical protein NTY02_02055 [Acidobacteria bacterium]|nr:hypothetical protein [Acidobacteriota bacterium]